MSSHKIAIRIVTLFLATLILAGCGAESCMAKYLERGKNYLKEEKYDKAAVELKNVLQIDPKNAEAYFLLARVEEAKHNFERAFGNYAKAVELNPDYLEARTRLAFFYLMSNNVAKASELTEALLAKNPADLDARLLKASIMSKQGNDRGAIQVYGMSSYPTARTAVRWPLPRGSAGERSTGTTASDASPARTSWSRGRPRPSPCCGSRRFRAISERAATGRSS